MKLAERIVIKWACGELYNFTGTSFVKVFIKMTTSVRYFLSHDLSDGMDPPLPLDTFPRVPRVLVYIRLVYYKDICNGYTVLETRVVKYPIDWTGDD